MPVDSRRTIDAAWVPPVDGRSGIFLGRARVCPMDDGRLQALRADQGGLFTRAQARAGGYSAKQLRHRMRTGVWQKVFGPVLSLSGMPITPAVRDRALSLAIPGGILAGPSAARRWGIDTTDRRSYIHIGTDNHPRWTDAVFLRGHLDPADIEVLDGTPVTSRHRTIMDCLLRLPRPDAIKLAELCLQRHWIDLDELVARVRRSVGRHGTPQLLAILRAVAAGARSPAERLAVAWLHRARITGWRANVPIEDADGVIGVGDIVFHDIKLVIEIDGRAYHSSPEAFERDRERQNRLVAAGWTVLRFTWRDLTSRPDYVVATILANVARLRRTSQAPAR